MGTKRDPGPTDCYDAALDDEPMFTLLARDPSAPHMVRQWAYERERAIAAGEKSLSDKAKVAEARACAKAMEAWRRDNEGAWRQPQTAETTGYYHQVTEDQPPPPVASGQEPTPGRRWGYMSGDTFMPLQETPLKLAGFEKPPFDVWLPTGLKRHVIEEP